MKYDVAAVLAQGYATVTFTKKDGTVRKMLCTIAPHLIPEDKRIKITEKNAVDKYAMQPEVPAVTTYLRVYDVEKADWRSFILANVTDVTVANQ